MERYGHGEQVAPMAEDVLDVQKVLMGHWTHEMVVEPLPLAEVFVVTEPRGQAVHTACPATEIDPDGHARHVLFSDWYVLDGQGEQLVAPVLGDTVPAGHGVQKVWPCALLNEPGVQATHVIACWYLPMSQGVHVVAPVG